jgi:hypothetical protein
MLVNWWGKEKAPRLSRNHSRCRGERSIESWQQLYHDCRCQLRVVQVALSLKETRAISGLADVLYDFLPGSGHTTWRGHVNFGTVATKVGVGDFWQGGSKKPALNRLLSQTLEYRRSAFQNLILEIVRGGLLYRQKQHKPVAATEIDDLNGHILELGFKFPELWDREFRASLEQTPAERAREHMQQAYAEQRQQSLQERRSQELLQLKELFFQLSAESDRRKAGFALEKLLNQLFELFDLKPRQAFRVIGEQIDGSFELDGQIYLMESKWEKDALPEADLLVFRGKIEGKSTFTRGVFIALNDVSMQARDALTRGKAPSFFVMNGHDLIMILSEAISLPDFLRKRVRLLAEEGRVCVPFSALGV